jgi:hypothetical protein
VVVNASVQQKFVGVHMAASTNCGYCNLLFKEDFPDADPQGSQIHLLPKQRVIPIDQQYLEYKGAAPFPIIGTIGEIRDGKALLYSNHRTKLTQLCDSPFSFPEMFPQKFEPSVLDHLDVRLRKECSVYRDSMNKWYHPQPEVDIELLNFVVECVADDLAQVCRETEIPIKVLSKKEAINRYTPIPESSQLQRDSSPGYPHTHTSLIGKKKAFFFDWNETENIWVIAKNAAGQELTQMTDELIQCARQGKRTAVVFAGSLKDEPLKLNKIEQGVTRSFAASPAYFTLAHRQYFHAAVALITHTRGKTPIKIGINASSKEWAELYGYLKRTGSLGFDADYKNWDATIPRAFMAKVVDVWNKIYAECDPNCTEEDQQIRRGIYAHLDGPLLLYHDMVVMAPGGQVSGQPGTAVDNSIVNMMYYFYVWMKLATKFDPARANYEAFKENVSYAVYGDDNLCTIMKGVQTWFNFENFKLEAEKLNLTITPADKTKTTFGLIALKDMTFLKRSFAMMNGAIVGQLSLDSFSRMLSLCRVSKRHVYVRGKIEFDRTTIGCVVLSALEEACLYGPAFYERVKRHLIERGRQYNIQLPALPVWISQFHRVYFSGGASAYAVTHEGQIRKQSSNTKRMDADLFISRLRFLEFEQNDPECVIIRELTDAERWKYIQHKFLCEICEESECDCLAPAPQSAAPAIPGGDGTIKTGTEDQAILPLSAIATAPAPTTQEAAPHAAAINNIDLYFYQQYVALANFTWSTTQIPGTLLWSSPITPRRAHANLAYLSQIYNIWVGSLEYQVKVAGTGFHAGALAVVRLPPNVDPSSLTGSSDFTVFEYTIIDPKTLECFAKNVCDQRNIMYHYMNREAGEEDFSRQSIGGYIAIYVLLQLNTSSTGASQIDVQVFNKAGMDFNLLQIRPLTVAGPLPDGLKFSLLWNDIATQHCPYNGTLLSDIGTGTGTQVWRYNQGVTDLAGNLLEYPVEPWAIGEVAPFPSNAGGSLGPLNATTGYVHPVLASRFDQAATNTLVEITMPGKTYKEPVLFQGPFSNAGSGRITGAVYATNGTDHVGIGERVIEANLQIGGHYWVTLQGLPPESFCNTIKFFGIVQPLSVTWQEDNQFSPPVAENVLIFYSNQWINAAGMKVQAHSTTSEMARRFASKVYSDLGAGEAVLMTLVDEEFDTPICYVKLYYNGVWTTNLPADTKIGTNVRAHFVGIIRAIDPIPNPDTVMVTATMLKKMQVLAKPASLTYDYGESQSEVQPVVKSARSLFEYGTWKRPQLQALPKRPATSPEA